MKKLTSEGSVAQTSTQGGRKQCEYCKKAGHNVTECRTRQREQQQDPRQGRGQWNNGATSSDYPRNYGNEYVRQDRFNGNRPQRYDGYQRQNSMEQNRLRQYEERNREPLLRATGGQPIVCYRCGERNHIRQHCRANLNTNSFSGNGQRAILSDQE